MKKRFNKFLTLLAVLLLGFGQMWGALYKTYALSDLTQTDLTYEVTGLSGNDQKLNKGERKVEVPCATASGTLYLSGTGANSGRYASIWGANGTAVDATRKVSMKSGYGDGIAFTSSDILTDGGKYYIIFSNVDGADFKINAFKYTLSAACSSGPVDPTASFSDGAYTIGGADLDLSSLFTTNSDGAVTYTITTQGTSDAALRADGKSLYATTAGSATVKVEQAATSSYNAFNATATITVSAFVPITSISLDYNEQHIYVGDVITITPTILPANASNKTLLWSVTSGASITQDGVLTAEAESDVIVTAAAQDGSDKEGTSHIYIDALPTCATLTPAESGAAIAAGDAIDLQELAPNASMKALTTNLSYTADGLLFGSSSSTKAEVTLNNLMQVGTVIRATIYNDNDDKARGLNLLNSSGTSKATWTKNMIGDHVETYTVVAGDGLAGSNVFQLQRNQNAYLKDLSIANCGAELLDLSSAVTPDHDPAYATVTLSATKVVAGGSATANYSIADPTAWDFDGWEITSGDATIADATAAEAAVTMGTTASVITLKLKVASPKHTVTYYDGVTELGTELVVEGENPTAAEIVVPHKLGYAFAGWSTTDGGAVVALNTISVAADMPLFAVFNAVNCSAQSGTIFSVILNKPQAENCTIRSGSGYETEADLIKYGTVSGGIALAKNSSTSNHIVITTDPKLRLLGGNGKVHIQFDCALQEGDKIRTTIENQNIAYTTSDSRSTTNYFTKGTDQELTITSGHALENASEIYLWAGSSNDGRLISLEVIRPEKFAVTFNMHGHGDAVTAQNIISGGKVTEPATTDITGWDFGGWYKTYVAEPESYSDAWDFENDVVSAAVELHAKWTAHVASNDVALGTLSVNGEAITIVPSQTVYAVELPMGTSDIPTVVATANDVNAKACTVTQALAVDGSATIYVKAEDNTTEATYTINFSVADHKDLQLVFKTGTTPCVGSASTASQILSNNAAVSTYINQITFTNVEGAGDNGAEGSSLNVGKKAGNMFTLSAKPGFAFQAMNFLAKIQDATCEYSIDGSDWTTLASTNTGGDECYAPFTSGTVHEFRLRSTGAEGVWIRNMQLTIVEACTPITLAWNEDPVEFEVGKAGYAIAATANNGGTVAYSSTDDAIVDVVAATGELTISGLGSATLKAATAEGDGTTYCANGGNDIEISKAVNTYYLVKFDAQNGDAADEVKYYDGDAAIALPADPTFAGYDFQGWFDAETGGNKYLAAITPAASMTVYAQWVAQCAGATITTQPTGASYLTGRTPVALVCEATAGNGGELTYEWFTCDDEYKANPVAATATPSTAVAGTFYYFCKVTEAGCGVEAFSDVVTITVTDKDPICLVKAELAAGSSAASITSTSGYYKDDANIAINIKKDLKLGSTGNYVKVAIDGANFQDGDVVEITLASDKTASAWLQIFTDEGTTMVAEMTSGVSKEHPNYLTISGVPANTKTLYLYRTEAADGNMNPYPTSMAVYRTSAPILNKVTVAGVEGTPDNTNHVAIEVPASTADAALDAVAYDWISNDAAWTAAHAPAVANAWEWGVENTVTLTDKDNDKSVYYVTISKAAPSADASLSTLTVNGQTIALADGVYEYSFELPYGTSVVPTVEATPNHVAAVATVDPCTLSGATITVVPESGAGDQQVYTLTFVISKWQDVVIWDGSSMTEVATSPDATTGMAWTVNGFSSITNYNATCGTKAYTKTLPSGGGASTTRNVAFTVPAGYVAKFYIAFGTHSDGNNRGMFIGSNATKTLDATSVLTLYSNSRTNLTDGTSEIVGAGTYYLNPMESVDFYEIRAFLRPGYARTAMLGNGVLGTVCVDHNVAIEDIQGVTVYELVGREPQYGKVAFDEVVSGQMDAGVPHVFQAHGDRMVLFFGDETASEPVDNHNGMYGTFTDQTLTELDDVYYFAQRALWSCVDLTSLSVPANRAYVKLSEIDYISNPNPAPGRRRILMGVNGETQAQGFENLDASEKPLKVMIDGTLYILRGEKVFDATGRLVK